MLENPFVTIARSGQPGMKLGGVVRALAVFLALVTVEGVVQRQPARPATAAGGPTASARLHLKNAKVETGLLESIAHEEGDQAVLLEVDVAPGATARVGRYIEKSGGKVLGTFGPFIDAAVPGQLIPLLGSRKAVRRVGTIMRPEPLSVVAEGVALANAPAYFKHGFTGRGTTVAVLDYGFEGYGSLLGTELPAHVVTAGFGPEPGPVSQTTSHGTNAAEIVHDMAPGARLLLVSYAGITGLHAAVSFAIAQSAAIISSSMGVYDGGPGDGTGPLDREVARAHGAGLLWVQAAGNRANGHWMGAWQDVDGDGRLDFGTLPGNAFTVSAGQTVTIFLRWNDREGQNPWDAACTDLDLRLVGPTGDVVARSVMAQRCSGHPSEVIRYTASQAGRYMATVRAFPRGAILPASLNVELTGAAFLARVPTSSLEVPADSGDACTVGGVALDGTLRPYSSQGPTVDGRLKPDLVAPAQEHTATGGDNLLEGTSFSAPQVAGAAAVLLDAGIVSRPVAACTVLRWWAVQQASLPPWNNMYGGGRLYLREAPLLGRRLRE